MDSAWHPPRLRCVHYMGLAFQRLWIMQVCRHRAHVVFVSMTRLRTWRLSLVAKGIKVEVVREVETPCEDCIVEIAGRVIGSDSPVAEVDRILAETPEVVLDQVSPRRLAIMRDAVEGQAAA